MSRVVNGMIILEQEPDGKCELCGKIDELRPYGPNNERICFECGQKDPITTQREINEYLFDKAKPIRSIDN
jgi:hypothetical protein